MSENPKLLREAWSSGGKGAQAGGMTVKLKDPQTEGGEKRIFFLSDFESMTDKELETRQFIVQSYC